ncbi:MAG: hypothetical protein LBP36_00360 [Oscillospiraceae bacterium]|jgi:hypothetical protein|nr:hypothetical protein [Oscillospiraceae bacterium]
MFLYFKKSTVRLLALVLFVFSILSVIHQSVEAFRWFWDKTTYQFMANATDGVFLIKDDDKKFNFNLLRMRNPLPFEFKVNFLNECVVVFSFITYNQRETFEDALSDIIVGEFKGRWFYGDFIYITNAKDAETISKDLTFGTNIYFVFRGEHANKVNDLLNGSSFKLDMRSHMFNYTFGKMLKLTPPYQLVITLVAEFFDDPKDAYKKYYYIGSGPDFD